MKHFIALMLLITTAVCGYSRSTNQPGQISSRIHNLKAQDFEPANLLKTTSRSYYVDLSKEVSNYDLFDLDLNALNQIQSRSPKYIKLYLPSLNKNVLLYQSDVLTTGFKVITSSGGYYTPSGIINYHGIIEGDDNSIAAITIANNEVIGLVSNNDGNYVIGKLKDSDKHIIYNDHNLRNDKKFVCEAVTNGPATSGTPDTTAGLVNKCVNWYYETDYDIFVGKGSVANVTSYILGLFNQVSLLYTNDGINIKLKTLFVWDTGDPYNGTTTSTLLSQFGQYRTTYDGDLAHLLGYVGSGGVAYLNTLCNTNSSYRMGYSDINPTYSAVPTYSWSVEVLTHEHGHNLGSPHTHDCAWNGNNTPIDGCGPAAGYNTNCTAGPLPTNGGTIMSYCHLISSVGINFNNGFGPQPTTLMQSRINTVTCLVACDTTGTGGGGGGGGTGGCTTAPATPAITGPATACSGTTVTYTATFDPNATSYLWTVPPGWAWSGTNTTNTLNVTVGNSSGNITVYAINACGTSATQTLPVVGLSKPGTASSITGPTNVCANEQNVVYTVSPIPGVQNYYWTAPTGSTINGTTLSTYSGPSTSISVNFGNKKGKISVKGLNICGAGTQKSINVFFNCKLSDIEEDMLATSVYPNPADNNIGLDVESSLDDIATIKIFDVHNRLCLITTRQLSFGSNHYDIDITNLSTGLYVVQVQCSISTTNNKILIAR